MFGAVALFVILLAAMIVIAVMRFSSPPVEQPTEGAAVGYLQASGLQQMAWSREASQSSV